MIFQRSLLLFASLAAFRVLNAVLCSTWFVPDEYWQSLEVAHRMVFGYPLYGHLTWEWHEAIRGYIHPLVFATLYKVLAITHLDWPQLLVLLPRVLQALLAALGDLCVLKSASLMFGAKAGKYALLCNVASWFTFYCCTRTLSNSTEAALTPVVLYCWMRACDTGSGERRERSYTLLYLALAAFAFLVRPTGAVLWAPLAVVQVLKRPSRIATVLQDVIIVGAIALMSSLLVDWYFYGRIVFVQLNFITFNVILGHSALFSTHPWHWYFIQGVPTVLFTSLPLCLLGVYWSRASRMIPFWLALGLVLIHSCLAHKEFRFVFAIVPIGSIYAGHCMAELLHSKTSKVVQLLLCVLLLANVPMAAYFSLVHQRGTTAVMSLLREEIDSSSSVLFLTPCHATPFYSHVHKTIPMKFLECPPPLSPLSYVNEAEQFYANPVDWLSREFSENASLPSHIIMFDTLPDRIQNFLQNQHYSEVGRVFHTHVRDSSRDGRYILLFSR